METISGLLRRLLRWSDRIGLGRKITVVLALAALASGVATYATVTGMPIVGSDPRNIVLLLLINLVLLLLLGAIVAKRLVELWGERRRGLAGSRLHVRLVVLFSLIAVVPTIIVAIFSYLFLSIGLESWFSDHVRAAVLQSGDFASAYVQEHRQIIRDDILAIAGVLNAQAEQLSVNPDRLEETIDALAQLHSLDEVIVVDEERRVLARSRLSLTRGYELVPTWAIEEARTGEVAIVSGQHDGRVRALVSLDRLPGIYLYAVRSINPVVVAYVEQTERAVAQYQQLEGQRSVFQITFAVIFLIIAMLFLFAAVWVGLNFATQLARPISGLIETAERVRSGDLSARVAEGEGDEEFASLSRAFNRMTNQLETQQSELIEANRQLDQRRRFTEAVLAGVSAGVIGLDVNGRLNLPNRSASLLLGTELDHHIGDELSEIVPEMAELFEEVSRRPDRLAQSQVQIGRRGRTHVLLVRIVAEQEEGEVKGYVVTFDEVTELLSAQRKAAWADVARRIAHEIKNPLTPIQLSAERLRRKYLREIRNDPETFSICTDTIIRHVEDIGRMVDEFSSFARMPAPVIKPENLLDICRQVLFLQRNAHLEIDYVLDAPEAVPPVACDARLIGQALTNLLKNAAESIEGREGDAAAARGHVVIRVQPDESGLVVAIEDNGKGLPEQERERLTEPYVTTRAKGTGLGLAIVKKIMEEHGGGLLLEDREGGGAVVKLTFSAADIRMAEEPSERLAAGMD